MSRRSTAECEPPMRFSVTFDYPVVFSEDLFHPGNPLLADTLDRRKEGRRHRTLVFLDGGLADALPGTADRVTGYFSAHADRCELAAPVNLLPGGEACKNNPAVVERVLGEIAGHRLCRQSCILAVGGGSLLDVVGLGSALAHRGMRLVRVPSTVLAQCDSGVGVKNGMNAYGQKNFIGVFAPPFAVCCDFSLLDGLPEVHWHGGLAEAFKVAIIKDADFFAFLCEQAGALRARDGNVVRAVIRRGAALHLEHIRTSGDPFETGSARPLDFGHWSAHRLEALSGYTLGHGQAVSIGIALDACYAERVGLLDAGERDAILDGLANTGLPLWSDLLERVDASGALELLAGIDHFREHLGGRLCVTLPRGIGRRVEVHELAHSEIRRGIAFLKERGGA